MESRKMVLKNLFTGQQWRNRQRTDLWTWGVGRKETVRCICKMDSQWELAAWLRELKQGLCINLEGRDEEGDGREVQDGGDTCIPLLIVALFTIARMWKQARCPLMDKWINKLWYIHTMKCYAVIKWNAFESVLMRWMNLEPIIQSKASQRKINKLF